MLPYIIAGIIVALSLALDALEKSLTGTQKTVILDAESALAQILMGAGG